jgi:phenylacetate-CoA ligase
MERRREHNPAIGRSQQATETGDDPRRADVLALRDLFLGLARMPRAEVEALLERELRQLLEFATAESAWWSERLERAGGSGLDALLRSLPVSEPRLLQERYDEMQLDVPGATAADYVVHSTSGTTGTPRRARKHAPSHQIEHDALLLVEWSWFERDVGKKLAFFLAVLEDDDAVQLRPPLTYLGELPPAVHRRSLDRPVSELLDALAEHEPTYLVSTGITTRLLARLQLDEPRPIRSLEQVLTFTDRVDPALRDLVREAFGARICDRYSSQEVGYIAIQCSAHDHLHVVPSVCVEIVDDAGEPCGVGVPGRVLVTALHSFAMPIIRYELGDIAEWGAPCDAGITWPVLERIRGRTRDVYVGSDGVPRIVALFEQPFVRMPELLDYQVVVFEDAILLVASTSVELSAEQRGDVAGQLRQAFGVDLPVRFLPTARFDWQGSWKRKEFYVVERPCPPEPAFEEVQLLVHGSETG